MINFMLFDVVISDSGTEAPMLVNIDNIVMGHGGGLRTLDHETIRLSLSERNEKNICWLIDNCITKQLEDKS